MTVLGTISMHTYRMVLLIRIRQLDDQPGNDLFAIYPKVTGFRTIIIWANPTMAMTCPLVARFQVDQAPCQLLLSPFFLKAENIFFSRLLRVTLPSSYGIFAP